MTKPSAVSDLLNRTRAIVETIVDGVITIDQHGLIDTVNPATEKIFGYSSEEMIGQNVSMLMPNPYRREHDGYINNYLSTGNKKNYRNWPGGSRAAQRWNAVPAGAGNQ